MANKPPETDIVELFAFLVVENDKESILTVQIKDRSIPFVTAIPGNVEGMKKLLLGGKKTVKLVRFSNREVIETL